MSESNPAPFRHDSFKKSTLHDRRAFLQRTLGLGAIAGAAIAGTVYLEERHSSTTTTTTTTTTSPTTTTTSGPATAAAWAQLGASLTGSLVLPSNPRYGIDRLLYNSKFVNLHPRAIAYCATADDVARCVAFATAHDVAIAARSGGHSYGGYSNSDGLVIDVSRMNGVSVDTAANTARVGAGAKLIDVYNVIGNAGRLLPGGSCPTVGIAGLALGGGIGVFGRKFGLTTDNIRSVSVVTADASTVAADASMNSDLLWASQGGGGGTFGVVTSFEFSVHPMPEVTLFTLQYPWAAAATMLSAWGLWIDTAPDELWSNCQLLSQGTYGFLPQIAGVYCGSPSELASVLAPLKSMIATAPTYSFSGSNSYLSAMEIEAGCSGLSIAACHLTTQNPAGRLGREAYSAKSNYVNAPMNDASVASFIDAVENLHAHAPTVGGGLAFDSYGGAINRVASDATAFVHRDKLACIQATYSWSSYTSPSLIAAGEQWLTWLGTNVFDPGTGAYQNYIDPTLVNWPSAYYGSNLSRLATIKSKYDPDNLFSFAQSIPVHARAV
ncbi:MAG: FAD-binding oxidoreductase [Acidimicrobiales bacterium]